MVHLKFKNTNLILNKVILQIWGIEKYSCNNLARPDYGLLYLLKGMITYSFDNCIIELKPGDIIYLPKGSKYEIDFDPQNGKTETILINFDVVGNTEFTEIRKPTCILNDDQGELYQHFKNVLNMYDQKDKSFLTYSYFYLCLNALQENVQTRNEKKDASLLKQAAKILTENTEISVDEICSDMHISRSMFQKKFKEYYGISPIAYRTENRIEKAKHLLETTDIAIKEIVDMLGYYDKAYFYRVFEKNTTLTPKQYRKKNKPHF